MHALGRAYVQRLGVALLRAIPVPQPYARGHDDGTGARADLALPRVDNHAVDLTVFIAGHLDRLGMVEDRGAVKRRAARHRQRQARIVDPRIEVQEPAQQTLFLEGRAMRQDFGRGQLLMQDALAPAAGDVIRPQQAFKRLGQALVEHAVLLQDREQERQALHQVPGVAPQPLALEQGMPHQAKIALLYVPQPAMHHF
ncbi:hypothetical protein D3C85_1200080 [compost metagenome]